MVKISKTYIPKEKEKYMCAKHLVFFKQKLLDWKNELKKNFDADWIGFCHYRRFWLKDSKEKNYEDFKKSIVQEAPIEWKNHEVVLRDEVYVNSTKLSKILKYGKRQLIKNPFVFLSKKKMTVKVHYDMYHGYGEMDKAIELLDRENREGFRNWVNSAVSFNANNVFVCKSPALYNDCLLYTSPSPRDGLLCRMPSSA